MCNIYSVTQLYGAGGAEVFFLLVDKFSSKYFALVRFEYEPYRVRLRLVLVRFTI